MAGTTLGTSLPLVPGLYQVNLSQGMTVTGALAAYSAEKGVLDAEPDYELTVSSVPNDPLLSQQWNLNNTGQSGGTPGDDIQAENAWSVTTGSPSIVVAVLDTGVDYDSPDLADNIWINQAEVPNSWYTKSSSTSGYNTLVYKSEIKTATPGVITFADLNNPVNKGLVWDNNGDGIIDAGDLLLPTTQGGWEVAGSTQDGDTAQPDDLFGWNFVNNTNNPMDGNGHGTNVAGILGATGNNGLGVAGVDWHVQIMPVEFMGSDGEGSVSNFIQALNYAVEHGAKITNNSWEGAPYSTALYDAFQNAQANGVISVVAAGNEGADDDTTPDYPASLSTSLNSVVTVAATDANNQLASFSNYGPQSVALAAPGVNIYSTLPNGQYGAMSGTSQATPQVAGALALVWGQHPTWSYTQVIDQVLDTTEKLPSLQGKVATGGLLDLAAAVGYESSTPPTGTAQTYSNSTATTIQAKSTTASAITVPAGATIGNLQVKLNATYADDGQLYAYLVAPNGKTIALVDNRGGTGANFTNTVFSQQATTAISAGKAPFSGTYLPESSLSQLDGLSAGGSWRLMIVNSGGSSGTLLNWSLTITPAGGTSSTAQTYSNSTATTIQAKSTTASAITVPAGATIGNLQVKLNATYADDGQLYAYLVAPNGKTIALVDNRGGTGANFTNTVFSQQATTAISAGKAPFSGTYLPESSLSQLNGLSAGGTWRLMIVNSGGSSGTLLNWSLTITPAGATTSSVRTASVTSPASSGAGSAAAVDPVQVSGQPIGEGSASSIPAPATSAQNNGTPATADQVFTSPFSLAKIWFGLLVGKRTTNNSTNN